MIACVVFSTAWIREKWLKMVVVLMSGGSVLSLAGLFMFPTVCKVCRLSVCDKSDCGRPRHTGVWSSAQHEKCFVPSLGAKEGIIIFPETGKYFSSTHRQSIRYNTGTAGSISSLYLALSQHGEASQDLAELWLFV